MITNERQFKATKAAVVKFGEALRQFSEIDLARQGVDPFIIDAQRSALEQQLSDLQTDLTRYRKLRSGQVRQLAVSSIAELGRSLIEARIVQGLSQRELGVRLGMKEQQVQRYEQDNYQTANLLRLSEVAEALHVDLRAHLDLRQPDLFDTPAPDEHDRIEFDPAKLPIKDMKKRGWLDEVRMRSDGQLPDQELAAYFVREAFKGKRSLALHKQNVRAGSQQSRHAVLAWRAQVLRKARRLDMGARNSATLEITTVRRLVDYSVHEDGVERAVKLLRDHGVAVVFEEQLPATHLDGAAMLLDDNVPVLAMTLREDRLDNFWFVLLHECAHLLLHRDKGLREGFFDFDDDDAPLSVKAEQEADEFARNVLIPSELWAGSFVRFAASREQVVQFAENNKIGVPIVAGRIRRERHDYTLFNDLIGRGRPKKALSDAGYWET